MQMRRRELQSRERSMRYELDNTIIRSENAAKPITQASGRLLEWIAGYVLEPKVKNPRQLIDLIFDNLPQEATTLRSLRRRAYGRYHTAAAFSAYQNRRIKEIRRHILPALIGDPSIIWNRGFVRIALQSVFCLGR